MDSLQDIAPIRQDAPAEKLFVAEHNTPCKHGVRTATVGHRSLLFTQEDIDRLRVDWRFSASTSKDRRNGVRWGAHHEFIKCSDPSFVEPDLG